jgi:peptidoglycan/LPS O-acetylase OafA/YrhL
VKIRSQHIRSLDGLRGMAVLAVMGSHLFPANTPGILRPVGAFLSFGATGVDLFFVLSGFLITGILFDSLEDTGYFRRFYARRALRIFPLYYGVLFVCFALTHWMGTHWQNMKWLYLFYLQNTDLAGPPEFFTIGHGISLNHFWSLAVEEQFYLVWPMVVFFVRGRRKLASICFVLASIAFCLRIFLSLHGFRYAVVNCNTFCRMDSLLIGGALALLVHSESREKILRWARTALLLVVAVATTISLCKWILEQRGQWSFGLASVSLSLHYTLMAIGSAALIAWTLLPSSVPRRIFEHRTLRFFGKYSYGLYVLHFVALGLLLSTFRGWIRIVTPNKGVGVVGAGILTFAVAILAAYASYNLYEKRFLRLKRYFDYDHPVSTDGVAGPAVPKTQGVTVLPTQKQQLG